MATNFTITDLDFDSILANFRSYLKSQSIFQDYNFDGSAITELLKLLSYNTFYNAFYINNIANEMYLDSATERSAAVSRAKSLGYVPTSPISSKANVDLVANVSKVIGETISTVSPFITLKQYASLTTSINNISYNFITPESASLYLDSDGGPSWVYKGNNIRIVEGTALNYAFSVTGEYEKYVIPNSNIDLDSLIVRVYDNASSLVYSTYSKASLMTDNLSGTSMVYWVYEGIDGKYYLEFGNGILGKNLAIGNVVYVEYIKTNGSAGNGAKVFSAGNYSYSNNVITETSALTITPSDYTILNLSSASSLFSKDSFIRGHTSNSTAYVYSFDSVADILTLYSSNGSFVFGETIKEEASVIGNTIYGSTGIVIASRTVGSSTEGGSDIESIESIKQNAPKLYASQNRLITSTDYESIIKKEYPYIDSVICWGGEEETPQQLGTIFLGIKPKSRASLEVWEKSDILVNIVNDRKAIGMTVEIVDPDYIFIYPSITIKYSSDTTSATTQNSIESAVTDAITTFGLNNLVSFKNTFYYSPFCSVIDNANEFILGNDTSLQLLKEFNPILNIAYTSSNVGLLNFSNPLNDDKSYYPLRSTSFSCNPGSGVVNGCYFIQNPDITQLLSVMDSNANIIVTNAGGIDYGTGKITITNLLITDTVYLDSASRPLINVYISPASNDLVCSKNQILALYPSITNITAVPVKGI